MGSDAHPPAEIAAVGYGHHRHRPFKHGLIINGDRHLLVAVEHQAGHGPPEKRDKAAQSLASPVDPVHGIAVQPQPGNVDKITRLFIPAVTNETKPAYINRPRPVPEKALYRLRRIFGDLQRSCLLYTSRCV